MKAHRRLTATALVVLLGFCCLRWSAAAAGVDDSDSKALTRAFQLDKSSQADFAKTHDAATFYMQLQVTNLRPDLVNQKCVDSGFFTWFRKIIKQDAKTITLVATITEPDKNVHQIPLFQISKDETSNPARCLTDVVTNEAITPIYVANRNSDFRLDVQVKVQQAAAITVASTTVKAAAGFLSMTGGSAYLLQQTSSNAVANATRNIDQSLSGNWSSTNQETYHFAVNPWAPNNDWNNHRDQATFGVGSLIASAGGIKFDPMLLPTVSISPLYSLSVFGGGPGNYGDEDRILATHLALQDGSPLGDIFKLGVAGFTTDNALNIQDAAAMAQFCGQMRTNFPNFLTDNDALAARHAVLLRRTNFYNFSALRRSSLTSNCETLTDVAKLKTLSAAFDMPPDLGRLDDDNRNAIVKSRGDSMLSPAFASANKDKLTALLANPEKFTLLVSSDAQGLFPPPPAPDKKPWGGVTGTAAVDQLVKAGGLRTGCWQAMPTQNLRNLVGMVLSKTGINSAVLVAFDADYSVTSDTPDKGKVTKVSFQPVESVQALANLTKWPDDACPLQ